MQGPMGWLSLASAYVHQSQYQKAIPAYEAALRLSPNHGLPGITWVQPTSVWEAIVEPYWLMKWLRD